MRRLMTALAATSLLVATPAVAYDEGDKQDKGRETAREKAERLKECERKKRSDRACKQSNVPMREETKAPGPLDRAYNAPFF